MNYAKIIRQWTMGWTIDQTAKYVIRILFYEMLYRRRRARVHS